MPVKKTDVLVVGGGVIGCAIAYFLAKAGREVLVVEQGELGAQASGAAAGLLAPLGPLSGPGALADLLLASFARFPQLVPELEALSGLSVQYEQTGALRVVRNPKRVSALKKRLASWQLLGLQLYWLDGDEARKEEPLLAADVCAAVYAPQESQLEASSLVQAYAGAASRLGAQFFLHCAVRALQKRGEWVQCVVTSDGETIFCEQLVLATGAWAGLSEIWSDLAVPVSPLSGQICAFTPAFEPERLQHIIFGEGVYVAPRGPNWLVGATRVETGFAATISDEGRSWLTETAQRLLPAMDGCSLQRTWAGLRPRTPDNHPVLGKASGWQNVVLAVGHNSVGVMLSAITGELITEMMITGKVPVLLQPFGAERFLSD